MKPFLTVHHADPRVFFVKTISESEKCAVIDLQIHVCRFVLHEPNQGFAYCMSSANRAFVSSPMIKGRFEGYSGGWFGCSDVCLFNGLPVCNTTQLSHAVHLVRIWLGKGNWSIWKGRPKVGLFLRVAALHLGNLSLVLPPHLCLSLHPAFVTHVVITAQREGSVCSCRILQPAGAPANTQMNTVKNASWSSMKGPASECKCKIVHAT